MLWGPPSPGPCQQPCEDPGSSLLGPTTQEGYTVLRWACHHHMRRGSTPQPGPAPYQWALRSLPYHNRRLHTVQIGSTPRAYSSGDQRGVCCWDPQDVSYVRLLLQDWKTQLTHLIHRNKENSAKMFQMKEQDKNLRRRIKQSRDSNLNDRVQSNDHKDAQQNWEKNGWTQWEFE